MLLSSAHILEPFRKLRSFRKRDMGVDIYPENVTSHTTQYQEAYLKYLENKYCAKHQRLPVTQPDESHASIFSLPQCLQDLVNLLLIHMICPVMMKNTKCRKMGPKRRPGKAIALHDY
jgi:hypothetical protein